MSLGARNPRGTRGDRGRRRLVALALTAAAAVALGTAAITTRAPEAKGTAATPITVTTTGDDSDGNTSSAVALMANPGPDGTISLREAIEAINSDPGSYEIGFAPPLSGRTVTVAQPLPALTGGGVTVDGDTDGDGKPEVTLGTTMRDEFSQGLRIASSDNRLHGLELRGFGVGVWIEPSNPANQLPTHQTLADNAIRGLVIRSRGPLGVWVRSPSSPGCGVQSSQPKPCRTYDTWENTTITGNTIQASDTGIAFHLNNSGDRVEGATVTGNSIRMLGGYASGIAFAQGADAGDDGTPARISHVLIARNSIAGEHGIEVAAGVSRAQMNVTGRVRILDNRVRVWRRGSATCCWSGISLSAGSDALEATFPEVRPRRYPDRNLLRNVQVKGNRISGYVDGGVSVNAGIGARGSRNRVRKVRIHRNVIRSRSAFIGLEVSMGEGQPPTKRPYATGNRITRVAVRANRIRLGPRQKFRGALNRGGILLMGGGAYSRLGVMRDFRITKNKIKSASGGITIIGGEGRTARKNRVSCVRLAANRITEPRRDAIRVVSNLSGARGNRASRGGC